MGTSASLDVAATAESAWQEVARRSGDADREAIRPLREWLAGQANAHAALLQSGRTAGAADERSARELEALLLGRVARKELSHVTAAQHLYLLHRVGKRLRNASVPIAPTWVSSIIRPPPSPFPASTDNAVTKVEAWRDALHRIITKSIPTDPASLWPLVALSAVCNGALLDRGKLSRLCLMINRASLRITRLDDGPSYVDFLLPFEGLGNHHLQRWWCDPVSDLLLQRVPTGHETCEFHSTIEKIGKLLKGAGVAAALRPKTISDLLDSAAIWWSLRGAQVDLHVMRRTFASHSLTARCWSRLQSLPFEREPGAITNPGMEPSSSSPDQWESETELWQAVMAEHEWMHEVRQILESAHLQTAREKIATMALSTPPDDYCQTYLQWLLRSLSMKARNEAVGIGFDALAEPFLLAAPRLLSYLGMRQVHTISLAELDETYRTIIDACEPDEPVEKVARGLRIFHDHLRDAHGSKPLENPRETFGEGGALMPVDGTVISVDEYLAAHGWLEQQLQLGAGLTQTLISRVVLTLTFRCGLRRGEVFGLRLCDIEDAAGIYLHVRRYPGHSLKTRNAIRTIRIDALLPTPERALLRRWILHRHTMLAGRSREAVQQERLLATSDMPSDTASKQGTVRRVMQALHAVTGEPRLVLHHLRHACATWVWLKLRAPDYPEVVNYATSMPALCQELGQARRLRVLLCGATSGPSRVYSNLVARILGHGMPGTSLEHYIHVADLFLAASTVRAATATPVEVWQALTGASRTTVYEWLQRGPHGVVQGHRAGLQRSGDIQERAPATITEAAPPWRNSVATAAVRFGAAGRAGLLVRALHHYNSQDAGIGHEARLAATSHACGVSDAVVESWVAAAKQFASAFNMAPPSCDSESAVPGVPTPDINLHRSTVEALDTISTCLDSMSSSHHCLRKDALRIASERFNRRRLDVCFRGEKDAKAASQFLKFLDAAGLLTRTRLTVRRVDPNDTKLPHWLRSVHARRLPVKRLPPPGTEKNQASAYARWVGVQLLSSDKEAAGHAWRIGLFLACVAYCEDGKT